MPIQDFKLDTGLQVTGSAAFASSVSSSGGFTGSLFGTASYGQDANLLDGLDSTAYALTGSTNYFKATQIVSGSLTVTASLTASSLTASDLNIDYIDFVPLSPADAPAQQVGRVFVDNLYNEVNTWTDVTGVKLLQGQQLVLRAKCTDMATFTKGTVVRINGGTGANATFVTASWENDTNSADTLGLLLNSGVTNDFAYIIINGFITDINTDGYTPGQTLYLSSSGNYTNVVPLFPYHEVRLGQVVRAHASVGSAFVRVQNGYELGELHDVYTGSLSPGDLLVYENTVNTQWTNKKQLTGSYGLTGSLTASVGLSGALGLFPVLTGSSVSGTTAQFTIITGSAISGALIGTLNGVSAILAGTNLTASTVATVRTISLTSSVAGLTSLTSTTGSFTILSGTTTTGSTALFTTVTGSTITGSTLSYTTLNTTQMTSSGKILVDNAITIGNGKNSYSTNIGIGNNTLNSINNAAAINNIAIGYQALALNQSGNANIAIGTNALYSQTGSKYNNVGIGHNAGYANTDGVENFFLGTGAGQNANTNFSVLIGTNAGQNVKSSNVAVGFYALNSHADNTAGGNFALGYVSLQQLVSGAGNVAVGSSVGYGLSKGSYNILLGDAVMNHAFTSTANATASHNIAFGYGALSDLNYNADDNIAIGAEVGNKITTGNKNVMIGRASYRNAVSGNSNVVIGYNSLLNMTTGSNNIAVGTSVGSSMITGSGNVVIGNIAGSNNLTNNILIGDGAGNLRLQIDSNGALSGTVITGSTITGSTAQFINITASNISGANDLYIGGDIGIGVQSPAAKLEIYGPHSSGNGLLKLSSSANIAAATFHAAGTYAGAIYGNTDGSMRMGTNAANSILFYTNNTNNIRMVIDSAGKVGVGTESPATELDVRGTGSFYSIKFPSVQSSSTDPNTLDDYEEGTWTPALSASTTSNFTYITQTGNYTKIGRNIAASCYILINSTGSSAGNVFVSLPITPAASSVSGSGNLHGSSTTNLLAYSIHSGYVSPSATQVLLLKATGGGAGSGAAITLVTNLSNTGSITLTANYIGA